MRFLNKINYDGPTAYEDLGPCWMWIGAASGQYGQMLFNGRYEKAHRLAWWFEHHEWPAMIILHDCDNPSCVNPRHLRDGTYAENTQDMYAKGRGYKGSGPRIGRWR
jgi:hypothetical protein